MVPRVESEHRDRSGRSGPPKAAGWGRVPTGPSKGARCRYPQGESWLEVAALGTELVAPTYQEYGVKPEVADQESGQLGASNLALDAFSSGTCAHLRVCEEYWSTQDTAWKKYWGPHQGLMWIH